MNKDNFSEIATAVASLDLGRKYIGAEIAKEYVEIAIERIKNRTTCENN